MVIMPMRGCSNPIRQSIFSSRLLADAESDVRVASPYFCRCDWSCSVLGGIGSGSVVVLVFAERHCFRHFSEGCNPSHLKHLGFW